MSALRNAVKRKTHKERSQPGERFVDTTRLIFPPIEALSVLWQGHPACLGWPTCRGPNLTVPDLHPRPPPAHTHLADGNSVCSRRRRIMCCARATSTKKRRGGGFGCASHFLSLLHIVSPV